jgi:hypothetical protein
VGATAALRECDHPYKRDGYVSRVVERPHRGAEISCALLAGYTVHRPVTHIQGREEPEPTPSNKISVTFLRDRDHGGTPSQADDIAQRLGEFISGA